MELLGFRMLVVWEDIAKGRLEEGYIATKLKTEDCVFD